MKTLYFGYGSNLSRDLMAIRCPENKTARLPDWRAAVRGYANLVPSPGDEMWALLYALTPSDEANLDVSEGYFGTASYGEMRDGKRMVDAMFYVDVERVTDGWPPQKAYIRGMNSAIANALAEGVS
ncbi:hypothetical protein DFH07DRAFT_963536 [Mycena maculata]|uniref:Gamma-glutamylcyclotransferase AIG2-like domain-containing protein n=1 Tax=Mycena maculata TaxID=230809 RepID=A0AAD7N4B8_9AGAR|nr:hypothetical protein DFH07DRAFT_963536 [Mycena maculata]